MAKLLHNDVKIEIIVKKSDGVDYAKMDNPSASKEKKINTVLWSMGAHVVEFFEVTRVAYDILCSCSCCYYN